MERKTKSYFTKMAFENQKLLCFDTMENILKMDSFWLHTEFVLSVRPIIYFIK